MRLRKFCIFRNSSSIYLIIFIRVVNIRVKHGPTSIIHLHIAKNFKRFFTSLHPFNSGIGRSSPFQNVHTGFGREILSQSQIIFIFGRWQNNWIYHRIGSNALFSAIFNFIDGNFRFDFIEPCIIRDSDDL